MKHLKEAMAAMKDVKYISIASNSVVFSIQDGPVNEQGSKPGCQAQDMLEFSMHLIASLNKAYPCKENEETLALIDRALHWQDERTKGRIDRGVEGKNEA